MNPHRGSDFNEFLTNTDQPMTPTPRTDAAEILWNDTGLFVVPADFARYLERELAAERELADKLAIAIEQVLPAFGAGGDLSKAWDTWNKARK